MRAALSIAACLIVSAPAGAELRDLVLSESGDVAWIQLVFDGVPDGARLLDGEGVTVRVEGVSAEAGLVTPVSNSVLDAASLASDAAGVNIAFDLQPGWHAPQVRITDGRVVLRLARDPSAGVSGADAAAEARLVMPSELAARPDSAAEAPSGVSSETGSGAAAVEDVMPPEPAGQTAMNTAVNADECDAANARIADDPWDLDAMIVQAECARSGGDAAEAAELLERVTAIDPERFNALLMLAEIEVERGDTDAARALYEMAAGAARTDGEAAAARARMRALGE